MKLKSALIQIAIATVFAALVPLMMHGEYALHVAVLALIFAVLAASWNLVSGYGGMFTFGHQAFFGLGAYVSALLAMHLGISTYLSIMIGTAFAMVAGVVIGLPVLRLRGAPYIAIATLAFAEIVKLIADNLTNLTHGESGLAGIPPLSPIGAMSFSIADSRPYYYCALILLVVTMVLVAAVMASPIGLAFGAIRDSQDAAESIGVDVTKYKVLLFMLSSALAGMAGGLFAHYVTVLTPSSILGIDVMVQIIAMALIGGLGTLFGPVVGAIILTVGLELLRSLGDYQLMLYGALLVVVIIVLPRGLSSLPMLIASAATKQSSIRGSSWKHPIKQREP
ncbi:branched-chain amino acid ABC transporter permease [bacterium]|nr:MAG: branched-chain amino acid ABC transporter permease [bacterium]